LSSLADAVAALRRGRLVAAPTETLVGLLADARDEQAVARVLRAKGRPDGQPIGVLLPDFEALASVAEPVSPRVEALARAHWPGPLGLILPAREGLPEALLADGKISVRVPGKSVALDLARAFGHALTATSANPSVQPPPRRIADLDPAIARACEVILDGEVGLEQPSTLLDVSVWPPRCLREGAVPRAIWEAFVHTSG